MSDQHVRFPPDSTGKRVGHMAYLDIDFTGGTTAFNVGDVVTTPTTLISGTVIKVTGNTSSGSVYLLLAPESPTAVNNGEALQVNAVTRALASGTGTAFFIQKTTTVGSNNPSFGQFVDAQGAAFVRFTEGSQQFDAIGRSRMSQPYKLGNYNYHYDSMAGLFSTIKVGTSGTSTHDVPANVVKLALGTTAGDKIIRRSNKWHKVIPGVGVSMTFMFSAGDTGKANLIRRWGYFDDFNGPHFRQNGTALEVVVRTDASGSVVETVVPQALWNQDKADGTGVSGFNLDPNKANIYFIDSHWLGAMVIRLGAYDQNGTRVVFHEFVLTNNQIKTFSRTGSLPLSFELENAGITASTSECTVGQATVELEGSFSPRSRQFGVISSQVALTNTPTILATIRPKLTFGGHENRCIVLPTCVDISAFSGAADSLVLVEIVMDATLTGGSFTSVDNASSVESSLDVTSYTGGKVMYRAFVQGTNKIDLGDVFSYDSQHMVNFADLTIARTNLLVVARTLKAAETANCFAAIQWNEVRD